VGRCGASVRAYAESRSGHQEIFAVGCVVPGVCSIINLSAFTTWAELLNSPLCYRPCLIGRNIRVALVQDQDAKFPKNRMGMKSTWEEKLFPASPPPSEVEVTKILLEANVRGLPRTSYISDHTSKPLASGASVGEPFLRRAKIHRQQFNKPLEVRRRLTRVLMSYCVPLKEAMLYGGPESLMRIIRDVMIVYYEAYKLPELEFHPRR